MTLPTRTLADSPTAHLADHTALHGLYNGFLADRGSVYVATDGSDSNSGRSWGLAKATIAGGQAAGGTPSVIYVGRGSYNIDAPIELQDGQAIVGVGVGGHSTFGTRLQATATLGTSPVLVNVSGNLTSGGLLNLQLRGTSDANGGPGLRIQNAAVADGWLMDYVRAISFTSHGFHFDIPSGGIAGNPGYFGVIDAFGCGKDGVGSGVYLERPYAGTIGFRYLGGDDNGTSLLYIETLNTEGNVVIDHLKAERTVDGKHNNVVTVSGANSGGLSIGDFHVYHNVSGGTNPNALIKETGGTGLRWQVGYTTITEPGSNSYQYGYDNGTSLIPIADFILRRWVWNTGLGLKYQVRVIGGSGNPQGVQTAPVGSLFLRSDGSTGTTLYVKETGGTTSTGWVAK